MAAGDPEEIYKREVGPDALDRQREAARTRCVHCWAPAGFAHSEACPAYVDPDELPPPSQEEALF